MPVASEYFRWGTQSRKLYERLTYGPVTSSEISRMKIHQVDKQMDKIKKRIAGTGVTVKVRPINDGCRRYREFRLGLEHIENREASN